MVRGYLKLLVLKEIQQQPLSGYDLIKRIADIMGKPVSAGAMYPLLAELEEKKFVISKEQTENKKLYAKKTYTLTKTGITYMKRLAKEKELLLAEHLKILRTLQELEPHPEQEQLIKMLERFPKEGRNAFRLLHEWTTLKHAVIEALQDNDPKTELFIRNIIISAAKKIKQKQVHQ